MRLTKKAQSSKSRYEQNLAEAGRHQQSMQDQMKQAKRNAQEAERKLPLRLEGSTAHDANGINVTNTFSQHGLSVHGYMARASARLQPWPERQLASKLADLEKKYKEMAMDLANVTAERDTALEQVADSFDKDFLSSDLMCPILHELMREPVLAADGFTYERQAISKWMTGHNTSPMTGLPLGHRYLTQNYVLKRIITSLFHESSEESTTSSGDLSRGSLGRSSDVDEPDSEETRHTD